MFNRLLRESLTRPAGGGRRRGLRLLYLLHSKRLFKLLKVPRQYPVTQAYLAALTAAVIGLGICFVVAPHGDGKYPFFILLLISLLAAWVFGSGPGLAALMLGYFAGNFFFVEPLHTLVPKGESEFITLTTYLMTGFLTLFGVSALRHYMQTSAANEREAARLEQQVRERLEAQKNLQQAKDQLAALNASLEQNVADRTQALLQTSEDLNSFCYSVAHDLKAPLRSQASFAQLLLTDYSRHLGENGCDIVRHISNAAMRQSKLVDDLLAHLSVSRAEQVLEPVEIRLLVAEVLADLRPLLRQKKVVVNSSDLADWRVVANHASLGLVLQNILTNACKFVAPGVFPAIKIWSEKKGHDIRICVRDNGIGIKPEFHQKIFEVFQRLHSSRAYPGTGIGLAIVKRAVERMEGTVGVQSQEGKGSTFWFELPLAISSAAAICAGSVASLLPIVDK